MIPVVIETPLRAGQGPLPLPLLEDEGMEVISLCIFKIFYGHLKSNSGASSFFSQ